VSDESLQELERTLRASPDDAAARQRVVTLLARAGRRREALAHVEQLPASRDLSNELWEGELAGLDRAFTLPGAHEVEDVALDPTGALLAWCSTRGGMRIVATASGATVLARPNARVQRLLTVPGKVFWHTDRIECLSPGEERPATRMAPIRGASLLDASPTGDRLLLQGTQQEGVYTWPNLETLLERPCRMEPPVVSWETQHLIVKGLRGAEVVAFPGGATSALEGRSSWQGALGGGLVARFRPGLVVSSLGRGWTTTLYELRGEVAIPYARPSLSGRFVRLVLGGEPVRFELDLETGAVLACPDRVERMALAQTSDDRPGKVLWHPRADLVFQTRRGGTFELRSTQGHVVKRLPQGAAPMAWTQDGRTLLVLRGAGEGRVWVELWRV